MQKPIILLLASLALAAAKCGGLGDPNDRESRRDCAPKTTWDVKYPGVFQIKHEQKLYEDTNHRIDGSAKLNHHLWDKEKPTQVRAKIDYFNANTKTNVGIEAVNNGRLGTDLGVLAVKNIFKGKNEGLDVGVKYGQHFGGRQGNGEPFVGAFVNAQF